MRLIIRVALRQLWARKLLNSIAICGVTLGVLVLIAVTAILQGFQQRFLLNIIKVSPHVTVLNTQLRSQGNPAAPSDEVVAMQVTRERPSDRELRIARPRELMRALERMPGVSAAAGVIVGSAVLKLGTKQLPVTIRGIEATAQERVTPISRYVTEGRYHELRPGAGAVVIGAGVAKRVGARVGDSVFLGSPVGRSLRLRVVAVFDAAIPPVDNSRVYLSLRDAQNVLGKATDVERIELRLDDPEQAKAVAERLERALGYDSESWQETNANFLGLFRQQNVIIRFVTASVLALGGFGILAIQIMIVLQKRRDIAILRSVGFHRRDILAIFLTQGGAIALLGALLGDLGGHLVVRLLGQLKTPQESLVRSDTFLVFDDPRVYVEGTLFALAVGLLAALLPAYRASRVEPVDVLRGQFS
jgi:lipoprotein-releasing system permease protein